jgi:hypothetical protein
MLNPKKILKGATQGKLNNTTVRRDLKTRKYQKKTI